MIDRKTLTDTSFIETLKKNIGNYFCKFCKSIGPFEEMIEHIAKNQCRWFKTYYSLMPGTELFKQKYLRKHFGFYISKIDKLGIELISNTVMQIHLGNTLEELTL